MCHAADSRDYGLEMSGQHERNIVVPSWATCEFNQICSVAFINSAIPVVTWPECAADLEIFFWVFHGALNFLPKPLRLIFISLSPFHLTSFTVIWLPLPKNG